MPDICIVSAGCDFLAMPIDAAPFAAFPLVSAMGAAYTAFVTPRDARRKDKAKMFNDQA